MSLITKRPLIEKSISLIVDLVTVFAQSEELIDLSTITSLSVTPKTMSTYTPLLIEAGILVSKRGKGGGYKLAQPATEISIKQIVEPFLDFNDLSPAARDISEHLLNQLGKISLQDLLNSIKTE